MATLVVQLEFGPLLSKSTGMRLDPVGKHKRRERVEEGRRCTAVLFEILASVCPHNQRRKHKSGGTRRAAATTQHRDRTSQPDSLHLTQCNLVLCPVVELGRSRRLMAGHLLGVLEPSVVLQVNRDAGCPPGVTSDGGEKTRRLGPLPYCCPGVVPVKSSSGHCRSKRINALEQRLPA